MCMIWHGIYVALYKQNPDLAELADWWAMLVFAVIVLLVHIMQICWFFIGNLFCKIINSLRLNLICLNE